MSYILLTLSRLGDLVNSFRVGTLGLEPVSTLWAPGQLYRLKVPYTYMWSPGLVPKPEDWGPEIDISGFVFLDLASNFEPPEDLVKFLDDGEPPIYIGFGSIVVDDPDKFTKMIFEAVEKAGVRALVSKGWGGLGDDNVPDGIYMLENTPHDWLFPKVKAVVHHGGAGTTAIGLKCGKPTMVVPFFGDQQFWGSMIARAGAGAEPVPYKDLTLDKLADGIKDLLTDKAREEAEKLAKGIDDEGDGAKNAVKSFHRSLTLRGLNSMCCSILEDRVAVWNLKKTNLRLSALAAEYLVEKKKVSWKQLRLIRHNEWNDFEGPGEPITGGATAIMGSLASMAAGVGSVPFRIAKISNRRKRHEEKKKKLKNKPEVEDAQLKRKSSKSNHGTVGKGPVPNGKPKDPQQNGKLKEREAEDSSMESSNTHSGTTSAKEKEGQEKRATPTETGTASIKTGISDRAISEEPMSSMSKEKRSGEKVGEKKDGQKREDGGKGGEEDDDEDKMSDISDEPDQTTEQEMAEDLSKSVGKTGEAIARGTYTALHT
jgi:hypothetical protein